MHLTRAETSKNVPIARRGTRYVARPLGYARTSISVLVAIRDMLHLAHSAREVKEMIKEKLLKINGRIVRDYHEPICLFSIFEAGKKYKLTLLPTGRFALHETKDTTRIAKVINKTVLRGGTIQLNFHDGTNLIAKEKIAVGDSVELDMSTKVIKVIRLEKGKKVFVQSGRNQGETGVVEHIEGKKVSVKIHDRTTVLEQTQAVAL